MRIVTCLFSAACLFFSSLVFAEPLDLNMATAQQLASVMEGVGEAKARAIVAYRDAHGPFQRIEDLSAVKGIGESTLRNNRDKISVSIASE